MENDDSDGGSDNDDSKPFIKMDGSIRWHLKGQHLNRFG